VYGCKNLFVPGIVAALMFVGSTVYVQAPITEQQQRLQRSLDGLRNLAGIRD
jgi:hypothetical protein